MIKKLQEELKNDNIEYLINISKEINSFLKEVEKLLLFNFFFAFLVTVDVYAGEACDFFKRNRSADHFKKSFLHFFNKNMTFTKIIGNCI